MKTILLFNLKIFENMKRTGTAIPDGKGGFKFEFYEPEPQPKPKRGFMRAILEDYGKPGSVALFGGAMSVFGGWLMRRYLPE